MKKNVIIGVILCAAAFAAGYLFGSSQQQDADKNLLGGDINQVNRYGLIIDEPEKHTAVLNDRMQQYLLLTKMVGGQDFDNEAMTDAINQMEKLTKQAAKSINKPEKAYEQLAKQGEAGKAFVDAADGYIGQHPECRLTLGSQRDLVASFCYLNAMLTQNDAQIDYWSNTEAIVEANEMVYSLDE